jgi:hypothetical protein
MNKKIKKKNYGVSHHRQKPLNSVNQMIFDMEKCGVFFAVRTEFLNII